MKPEQQHPWPPIERDDLLALLEVAREALGNEFTFHHVSCNMDMTEEEGERLKAVVDKVMQIDGPWPRNFVIVGRLSDCDNEVVEYTARGKNEAVAMFEADMHLAWRGEYPEEAAAGEEPPEVYIEAIVETNGPALSMEDQGWDYDNRELEGNWNPPLDCPHEDLVAFIQSLKEGERVIEAGVSGFTGWTGTVVFSNNVCCVAWDGSRGMVTSCTGGTRRISDWNQNDPVVKCGLCGKSIWFADSYSPADDAICAECDTEVTGREHPPSLDPAMDPKP